MLGLADRLPGRQQGPRGASGLGRSDAGTPLNPEAPGPPPSPHNSTLRAPGNRPLSRTFHAGRRSPERDPRPRPRRATSLPARPSRRHLWLCRSSPGRNRASLGGAGPVAQGTSFRQPPRPGVHPSSSGPAGPTSPEGLSREVSPATRLASASPPPPLASATRVALLARPLSRSRLARAGGRGRVSGLGDAGGARQLPPSLPPRPPPRAPRSPAPPTPRPPPGLRAPEPACVRPRPSRPPGLARPGPRRAPRGAEGVVVLRVLLQGPGGGMGRSG